MSGVFNPKNCNVPFVAPIDEIPGVADCEIKPAPEPIHDCSDQSISMPPAPGTPGTQGIPGVGVPDLTSLNPDDIYVMLVIDEVTVWVEISDFVATYLADFISDFITTYLATHGSSGIGVLITESVPGSAWNSTTCTLTPSTGSGPQLVKNLDGTYSVDTGTLVNFECLLTQPPIFISGPGKAKIGIVSNGKLVNVDCNEIDCNCLE
jgi:hypothetical protein